LNVLRIRAPNQDPRNPSSTPFTSTLIPSLGHMALSLCVSLCLLFPWPELATFSSVLSFLAVSLASHQISLCPNLSLVPHYCHYGTCASGMSTAQLQLPTANTYPIIISELSCSASLHLSTSFLPSFLLSIRSSCFRNINSTIAIADFRSFLF